MSKKIELNFGEACAVRMVLEGKPRATPGDIRNIDRVCKVVEAGMPQVGLDPKVIEKIKKEDEPKPMEFVFEDADYDFAKATLSECTGYGGGKGSRAILLSLFEKLEIK